MHLTRALTLRSKKLAIFIVLTFLATTVFGSFPAYAAGKAPITGPASGSAGSGLVNPAEDVIKGILEAASSPEAEKASKKAKYKEGELLVKFKKGTSRSEKDALHGKNGSKKVRAFPHLGIDHITLKAGLSVEDAVKLYKSNKGIVEYAEPNFKFRASAVPNDPKFSELWGLNNTGQSGGTVDKDIDAPEAWDITTGSSDVVVAVIDTGVDYNHEDLAANMWQNPFETPGNGVDDDGNGYVDDVYGMDGINADADPMDDHFHGTHVAGTIGGVGNNAIGVAGVNWNVKIMALKFLDAEGYGYTDGAIECLEYVRAMKAKGVNIVATNNSWVGGDYSQALYNAIDAQREVLFMAAAGNDDADNNYYLHYPSSYDLPNIVSVAATDRNDEKAWFSSYGSRTVHVSAPGHEVTSTVPNNGYARYSGTSMATPHVAGLAALIKAQDPTRDWRKIKNLILSGGDDVASMDTITITGKRINAYGSLTTTDSPVFAVLEYPATFTVGTTQTLSALSVIADSPAGPVTVTLSDGTVIELLDDGVAPDLAAGDGTFVGNWVPTQEGERLVFSSPAGSETVYTPAIRITTSYLPNASLGEHYSQTLSAAGGLKPYTWSIVSGSLPDGLTLNSLTGEISGTISKEGVFYFTAEVTDSFGSTARKKLFVNSFNYVWSEVYDHGSLTENAYGVAVDSNGNSYVTGTMRGMTRNFLTVKYDSAGNRMWVKEYDSGSDDNAYGITVDKNDYVYVVGYSSNGANDDYRIVKYDPSGNVLWTKTYDTGTNDRARSIAVDASGNIYVGGYTYGATVDFLMVKFDSAGNALWSKKYDTGQNDYAYKITLDGNGNVFMAGTSYHPYPDYLAVKFDSAGTVVWAQRYDSGNSDYGASIAVDASGNAYVTGNTSGVSGDSDYLTIKYDASGNMVWTKTHDGAGGDYAMDVLIDKDGYIYVTGYAYRGSLTDVLTVRYDAEGNEQWARRYAPDYEVRGNSIAIDNAGYLYVAGDAYLGYWDYHIVKFHKLGTFAVTGKTSSTAVVGEPYSQTTGAMGGTQPYAFSITSGTLPPGLTLDSLTGEISGAPTKGGTYLFILEVKDATGLTTSKRLTIEVLDNAWVATYDGGGTNKYGNNDDYGKGVTVDKDDNIYVTGHSYNGSNNDVATAKFDTSGNILWSKKYDGGANDTADGVATDASGNVYVAGSTIVSGGYDDFLTIKYDSNGNQLWARTYGSTYSDAAYGVVADKDGNVYVTGATYNGKDRDYLTIKYDANGNTIWTKQYNSRKTEEARGIDIDASGNVYVTGHSDNGKDLDYLTIKYDANGNELWSTRYDSGSSDAGIDVATDASGNVYVAGRATGANADYLTVKYDAAGNQMWTARYDSGVQDNLTGLAVGPDNNAYVTGYFYNGTNNDCVTKKYDANGNELWSKTYDSGQSERTGRIALDGYGNIYVAGDIYVWNDTRGAYSYDYLLMKQKQGLVFITESLASGKVGEPYSQALKAIGGTAPYDWSVTSGALPDGLALNAQTGETTGTPTAAGTYEFTATITDAKGLSLSRALSITIIAPAPDLVVSSLTAPSAKAGSTISVADTTTNNGDAAAAASTTRFYFSADGVLSADDVALGSRSVPSLAAGASSDGTTDVTLPTVAKGTYYIIAVADADGAMQERDENNNSTSTEISIR